MFKLDSKFSSYIAINDEIELLRVKKIIKDLEVLYSEELYIEMTDSFMIIKSILKKNDFYIQIEKTNSISQISYKMILFFEQKDREEVKVFIKNQKKIGNI